MTREEAIQELQNCKGLIQQDGQDYLDERDFPLLDMAIEALTSQNLTEPNNTCEVDLISRQAAIDVLEERLRANGYSNVALVSELNRSIGYLMRLPSAEAVQGEWIEVEDYNGDIHYKCDQCGEEWTFPYGTPKENNANFCPNCGARMKGGEEE